MLVPPGFTVPPEATLSGPVVPVPERVPPLLILKELSAVLPETKTAPLFPLTMN